MTTAPVAGEWRNRIVASGTEDPRTLTANPGNWRTHPKRQRAAIRGSLATVGWVQQILINRTTGHVVDGHARLEEALATGATEVPVLYIELSAEEEAIVLATLDPIGAMADQDSQKLAALLQGVSVGDAGLSALLKDLAPIRHGMVDPDDVPTLSVEEPRVKSGQLWALGEHRLLCGDCTDPANVERLLGGAKPTLLSTDPPYGVQLDHSWRDSVYNAFGPAEKPYMQVTRKLTKDASSGRRKAGHQNVTLSGDTRADWSPAFALVPSLLVGYVWHSGVHAAEVAEGLLRIGFEIASQVIWDKGHFAMGRGWYHWAHEPCWVIRKPGVPNLFTGSRTEGTIWRVASPKMIMAGSTEEKQDHPAQKPVLLTEIPLRCHEGDVYDPFLGSGTTLIGAERMQRRCFGFEIDPRYAQLIIDRWERFTGGTAVLVDG